MRALKLWCGMAFAIGIGLQLLTTSAMADVPAQLNPLTWKVVFSDEFNGTSLDTTKWNTTFPWGGRTLPSNNEGQWYLDNAFEYNSSGIMRIRANNRSANDTSVPESYKYTSGMIASWKKFYQQYGYFEIRTKVPKGKGLWPAFWLMPENGSWPPETDILELLGHDPKTAYFSNHYTLNGQSKTDTGWATMPDLSLAYHNYGLYWSPTALIWYIDGQEKFRTTKNIPTTPLYLIANLAVGGNWPGYPDSTTVFPNYMYIDYVRVYTKK
jgi:beta-glucanase (GH16 family)